MAIVPSPEEIYNVVAGAFDVEFYLTIYEDVARAGLDPIRHFLDEGSREGRDPAPWFSTRDYLEAVPEASAVNPFHHYLSVGWCLGKSPQASEFGSVYLWSAADTGNSPLSSRRNGLAVQPVRQQESQQVAELTANSDPWAVDRAVLLQAFDADYYHSLYPDISAAGIDPLDHFLAEGWREGRAPSRGFSVPDYLEFNPDVAALGINPFLHYVVAGRSEGRLGVHDLGFRHRMLSGLLTVPERQAHARKRMDSLTADPEIGLEDLGSLDKGLHLTFSHDDFTANVGGLQLCLQREAAGLARRGIDHLHLFPVTPWPTVRPDSVSGLTGVLLNGVRLGVFSASEIAQALRKAGSGEAGDCRTFAVHSLLGHAAIEVLDILKAAGLRKGYLWIHDFTSICAGFHLMRNDVADCGAPPLESPACSICVYSEYRQAHIEAHNRLFAGLDITVAAPSPSAYATWRLASTAPGDTPHIIHAHATLTPTQALISVGRKAPLKVAYIGMTALHKGWAAFEELSEAFADDPRYAFLHLGSQPGLGSRVPFRQISVSGQGPTAMRDALMEEAVDVVLLWSLCRETFSLAAHEAAAAGVFILTHADSGNIAAFVRSGDFGQVLESEAELMALFKGGQVANRARRRRKPMLYDLSFSETTADLLEPSR